VLWADLFCQASATCYKEAEIVKQPFHQDSHQDPYGRSQDLCLYSAQGGYTCAYHWSTHSYTTEVEFVR